MSTKCFPKDAPEGCPRREELHTKVLANINSSINYSKQLKNKLLSEVNECDPNAIKLATNVYWWISAVRQDNATYRFLDELTDIETDNISREINQIEKDVDQSIEKFAKKCKCKIL